MLSFIVIYCCVVKPRKKRFMIIKESSKIPEDASLKGKIILEFSLPILERNPFDRQSLREDKDGLKQFLSLFRFGVVERFFSTQNWPRVEYGKMSNLFNVALNAQTLIMKNHSENVEFRRTFFFESVVTGFIDEYRQQFLFHGQNERRDYLSPC